MRAFLIIALFGLLFLTGCAQAESIPSVYNARGARVGEVQLSGETGALIIDAYGQEKGSVRGTVVRSATGKRMGAVVDADGTVSIRDEKGKETATLQGGDCYADGRFLGRITEAEDKEAAGGACLLLLINRD